MASTATSVQLPSASSLFAAPQPPLGYVWAPCTIKGYQQDKDSDNAATSSSSRGGGSGAAEREIERSFLMGACGKHALPKVKLVLRPSPKQEGGGGGGGSSSSSSTSSSFEPPLMLIAADPHSGRGSSSSAVCLDEFSAAYGSTAFAALPGDVLWEECPSIVFTDTTHLASLLAVGGGGKAASQQPAGGAVAPMPSVAQRVAAVWSMMSQKSSASESAAATNASTPTTAPAMHATANNVAATAFNDAYGRGFSAVATGLVAMSTTAASASSSSSLPQVDVSASLQDALTTLGYYQSAACWKAVRGRNRATGEKNGGGGEADTVGDNDDADGDSSSSSLKRVTQLIAPTAIVADSGVYTQQQNGGKRTAVDSSSSSSAIADTAVPPLLMLDKYFGPSKEVAAVPAALMAMVQRVTMVSAPSPSSGNSICSHNGMIEDAVARPLGLLSSAAAGPNASAAADGNDVSSSTPLPYAAASFACLWRLCQERSLLFLKDPDGAAEGTPIGGGGDGNGAQSSSSSSSASTIMSRLLQQQQQQAIGGGGETDSSSNRQREAISVFCPIAAAANFTKLAAVANAQLVIVQQAMPIITLHRRRKGTSSSSSTSANATTVAVADGDDGYVYEEETNFRYRFVVQAVATRPIRRDEEIRLPLSLLSAQQYAATSTAATSSLVARPAIGIASASHLAVALKQITEAIAKNPTASAQWARFVQGGSNNDGTSSSSNSSSSATASAGGGGSDSSAALALGRIKPFVVDADYRRHLERVRASLEQYLRGHALFEAYLGHGHASRAKAGELLTMMQRAAAKNAPPV